MTEIVANQIRTPDGTIIRSRMIHDYVEHKDANGRTYMVDGGGAYLKRFVHSVAPFEELSVYSDEPHEVLREVAEWGTYGKGGDQPFQWKAVKDMSTGHIEAVLKTQPQCAEWLRKTFERELEERNA